MSNKYKGIESTSGSTKGNSAITVTPIKVPPPPSTSKPSNKPAPAQTGNKGGK